MAFSLQVSKHGRRLGLSTTGGIVSDVGSTGKSSTAIVNSAQMWGDGMTVSRSSGATLDNCGLNVLTSSTLAAMSFNLNAPVKGVTAEIISETSSTTITIETASSLVTFRSSAGAAASTALTLSGASGLAGAAVVLRGLSTTKWQVLSKNT
jgi:hypothetical protein